MKIASSRTYPRAVRVLRTRWIAAAAIVAAALAPAPTSAAPCQIGKLMVPSRTSLCHRIVLGERGFVQIELEEEVLLKKGAEVASGGIVRSRGLGRSVFSAIIIRGVSGDAEDSVLVMGTMPAGAWRFRFVLNMNQTPHHVEMPAGGYQVYLLGPRRATFEIDLTRNDGPPLRLDEIPTVRYERRTLGTWDDAPHGTIWAGDTGPMLREQGFGLTAIWAESKAHVHTASGSCYYGPGGPASPPATAFAPGCPWFSPNRETPAVTAFSQPAMEPTLTGHVHIAWPLQPGRWSLGSWMKTSGVIHKAEALGIWLEFAPKDEAE